MSSLADAADGRTRIAADPVAPTDAAVRVAYQAVRALVAEAGVVAVEDLTTVTRLDAPTAAAAMERLARAGPFEVEEVATAGKPAWTVVRTGRW